MTQLLRRNQQVAVVAFAWMIMLGIHPAVAQVEPTLRPPALTQTPTGLDAPTVQQPLKTQLESIYGSVPSAPQLSGSAGSARPRFVLNPPQTSVAPTGPPRAPFVPGQHVLPMARVAPNQSFPPQVLSPRVVTGQSGRTPLRVANLPVDQPFASTQPQPQRNLPATPKPPAELVPPPKPATTTWGAGTASPPVNPGQELGGAGIVDDQPSMLTPVPEGAPVGSGLTTYGTQSGEAGTADSSSLGDDEVLLIDPNMNPPWTKRLFPNWDPIWHDSVIWQRFDRGRQQVSAGLYNTVQRQRSKQELKHGECQCNNCRAERRRDQRDFGGWASWGSTYNSHGNSTSTGNDPMGFNNFANGLLLNQAWLYAERRADPGYHKFDWGYRFDFLFGADGPDTSAFGDETWDFSWATSGEYGFALPQMYATVGYSNLLFNMGRFYTILGYETVAAPQNFFYSHTYTFSYNQPFTHTGVLAQYDWYDNVTLYGGYSTGWDTGFRNPNDGGVFVGGVDVQVSPFLNMVYVLSSGDPGDTSLGETEVYMHSLISTVAMRPDLTYVLQWDYQNRNTLGGPDERSYGLSQYLLHEVNCDFALGARFEWFRDSDGAKIGNGPGDYYDLSFGINWRTSWKGIVRPEIRYDFFEGAGLPFDDNTEDDQLTFAIAGYWTF